jgi:hypothetical protein
LNYLADKIISIVGGRILAAPLVVDGQQAGKIPRVGSLNF